MDKAPRTHTFHLNTVKGPRKLVILRVNLSTSNRVVAYFEVFSFIFWRFQELLKQAYFFICDISTVWFDWCPKSEMEGKKIKIQKTFSEQQPLIYTDSYNSTETMPLLKAKSLIWPSCWPVGCIILRSTGNVLWIICKIILLDFGLQIFGFGSARTWTWPVTAFAVQLLLLRFLARGGSGIRVLPGLQKALVPFLVLPVCEDLGGGADGNLQMVTNKGIYAYSCGFQSKSSMLYY